MSVMSQHLGRLIGETIQWEPPIPKRQQIGDKRISFECEITKVLQQAFGNIHFEVEPVAGTGRINTRMTTTEALKRWPWLGENEVGGVTKQRKEREASRA